jgi:hypothetical protein
MERRAGKEIAVAHDQLTTPEARAQAMFQRVITHWAMDALSLRRRGLDRPTEREGTGLWAAPPELRIAHDDQPGPAPAIRWRPRPDIAA